MGTNSCFDIDFVVATVFCKCIELVVNFMYLLQKTHPYLHKDGKKNCLFDLLINKALIKYSYLYGL